MKCEVCIELLEEYVDGELAAAEATSTSAHLLICASCTNEFETLTAEQELYARYDRDLEVSPSMWGMIAEHTVAQDDRSAAPVTRFRLRDWFVLPSFGWSFSAAMAGLVVVVLIGTVYRRALQQTPRLNGPNLVAETRDNKANGEADGAKAKLPAEPKAANTDFPSPGSLAKSNRHPAPPIKTVGLTQSKGAGPSTRSDVLPSEVAFLGAEEQDTQRHIEQAENLLRSVRNIHVSEDESEVDVSYEKSLSRRLLNENVVLRRDAEMSGKFPTKTLLSDLEPFLIDIANLPDRASPDDLRVIKERVQKTEIVADLRSY
jgi:hypothetical protein